MAKIDACLVCGDELEYFEEGRKMECVFCHGSFVSNAACKSGHFVCDSCHAAKAIENIKSAAKAAHSKNPLEIAFAMMRDPYVHMHGPENHVLVGAALLSAYRNAGGELELSGAVDELARRACQVPGGACGFWGCCGAAVSTGVFLSIVSGATPLTTKPFAQSCGMTAASLAAIAQVGGPRCCKRSAFLSILEAAKYCKSELGVEMELPEKFVCGFSPQNRECIKKRCPFFPAGA